MFKSKTALTAGSAIALLLTFGSIQVADAGNAIVHRHVVVHAVVRPDITAGEAARIRYQLR